MSGIIVPILEKRIFDYGYLGASPAFQDVVLHPAIDVGAWHRVQLLVRLHQVDVQTGDFKFYLFHALPSTEDGKEFVTTTTGSEFAITPAITGFPTGSNIVTASGTIPQAYLKLVLRASQGTASNRLYGEFSAALVLRDI